MLKVIYMRMMRMRRRKELRRKKKSLLPNQRSTSGRKMMKPVASDSDHR